MRVTLGAHLLQMKIYVMSELLELLPIVLLASAGHIDVSEKMVGQVILVLLILLTIMILPVVLR